MPRRLSKRVLVRHTSGAEKEVLRTQLSVAELGGWKRVTSKKKRPPSEAAESTEPAVESDATKEEE